MPLSKLNNKATRQVYVLDQGCRLDELERKPGQPDAWIQKVQVVKSKLDAKVARIDFFNILVGIPCSYAKAWFLHQRLSEYITQPWEVYRCRCTCPDCQGETFNQTEWTLFDQFWEACSISVKRSLVSVADLQTGLPILIDSQFVYWEQEGKKKFPIKPMTFDEVVHLQVHSRKQKDSKGEWNDER
jgi:hypothetical protein